MKIILEPRDRQWCWTLEKDGITHNGKRGEPTEDLAAIAASTYARQLDLAAHFNRKRGEHRKPEPLQ
jgi:hypothetical protein